MDMDMALSLEFFNDLEKQEEAVRYMNSLDSLNYSISNFLDKYKSETVCISEIYRLLNEVVILSIPFGSTSTTTIEDIDAKSDYIRITISNDYPTLIFEYTYVDENTIIPKDLYTDIN